MKQKRVLILGGKPIGSVELVNRLHELGCYIIVTDFLNKTESPAKQIADEAWDISTADIKAIVDKIKENGIDAVMTGVHEFNINKMLELCEVINLPCYCKKDTWIYCDNKRSFKNLCKENNIPVAKEYKIEQLNEILKRDFPLIVKPVDGSGSRGFHVCNDFDELQYYYKKAKDISNSGEVLIERYIPYNSVIIHYTMVDGKCIFSGMSDKISVQFKTTGASVMGIQTFPSKGQSEYLCHYNERVKGMFENAGFTDGPIWIEAFFDGEKEFVFNEMGYRFGGSLTYYPVKYFTGIDQLDLLIANAFGEKQEIEETPIKKTNKNYCILPLHIKSGKIESVQISNEILEIPDYNALVPVHFKGDEIKDWGSAQQVFAYAHILYSNKEDLITKICNLLKGVKVRDEKGNNMIHTLFDINTLSI